MRETLRTTIAQFSSSGGRAHTRAANVRSVEPALGLPGSDRGYLYMLLQVTGNDGGQAALYRELLRAAQTAFYEAGGSLAAALNRALRSAHLMLIRANEASPGANWRAGMTVAVLQGDQLTISQAGPALVLVSHPRTIDQFPGEAGPGGTPLGGPGQLEIETFTTKVEPGSMLLIAQSDWLEQVMPEALAVAAAADNPALAGDYLAQLAGDGELSALLVGFGEWIVVEPPAPAPVPPKVTAPAPEKVWARPADRPRSVAPPPVAPPVPRRDEPLAEATAIEFYEDSAQGQDEWPEEYVDQEAASAYDEPYIPVAPYDDRYEHRYEDGQESPPRRSLWPLVLALIVIPVLIGGLVAGMLWLRTRQTDDRLLELLSGANAAVASAEDLADTDEGQARLRLQAVPDFLEQAAALQPDNQGLSDLQTRYDDLLARLDHVLPLYGLVPMWDFAGEGHNPTRVAVGGDALFVLDSERSEVYHFTLSELRETVTPAPEPIALSKAQQIGDLVVSDLRDITWVDAAGNQGSRLLALDTAGDLVSFDSTWGLVRVPISGREQWGTAELIRSYVGNLYVVDTQANQIWRYRPTDGGYEESPEPYFASSAVVDLSGVQSIAIDGSIWLLFADGRLLKFFLGEQEPFALSGLPDNLSAPTAIITPLDGDRLYIADSGNGRILEFSKDGQFQRQFRPGAGDTLRGVQDMFYDPTSGALYLVTSDKLYKADIPEPAADVAPATDAGAPLADAGAPVAATTAQ